MIVEEGWPFNGVGAEIAYRIGRRCFDDLDAPVERLTGADMPMPYNHHLEQQCIPDVPRAVAAVEEAALPRIAQLRRSRTDGADPRYAAAVRHDEDGVLQKWRKKEGDKVSPGEVDRRGRDRQGEDGLRAFDEGVLLKRLVEDGDTVQSATPIAIIGKAGEDIAQAGRGGEGARGGGAAKAAPAPAAPARPRREGGAARPPRPRTAAAAAAKPAPAPAPLPKRAAAPAARPRRRPPRGDGKVLASPLARRLATELGIDLRSVQGTGPGGRIVERDVKAAAEGGGERRRAATDWHAAEEAPQTSAPRVSAAAPLPAQIVPERRSEARPADAAPAEDIVKPLSMMRQDDRRRAWSRRSRRSRTST